MYYGSDLKCIGMVIGNILYGGCIVMLIEVIFEVFENCYFDDLFFYFFDNINNDDDFDDSGGGGDNDGDDESDGFNYD